MAELTAYLNDHQRHFDVIISADTLCYFGELDSALAAAHGALRRRRLSDFQCRGGGGRRRRIIQSADQRSVQTRQELSRLSCAVMALQWPHCNRKHCATEMDEPVVGWIVTAVRVVVATRVLDLEVQCAGERK